MSAKKDRRIRHGELLTEAWNPSYLEGISGQIVIGEETLEMRSIRLATDLANYFKSEQPTMNRVRAYAIGSELRVIASIDGTSHGRLLHVSASCRDRLPTWTEMIAIKRRFYPDDVAGVMVMPEEEVYVNQHEFTLHIWQLPEKWGMS